MESAICGQVKYLMKIGKEVAVYGDMERISYIKLNCKQLYKSFAFGINVLLTRHHSYTIQLACLKFLKRFYDVFEMKNKQIFEDTIITCLQSFA